MQCGSHRKTIARSRVPACGRRSALTMSSSDSSSGSAGAASWAAPPPAPESPAAAAGAAAAANASGLARYSLICMYASVLDHSRMCEGKDKDQRLRDVRIVSIGDSRNFQCECIYLFVHHGGSRAKMNAPSRHLRTSIRSREQRPIGFYRH